MKFNIPKRHFYSEKATEIVTLKMPIKMIGALNKVSSEYKWNRNHLIEVVLDQFYGSLKGKAKLPDHEYRYDDGDRKAFSIRIDSSLKEAMDKWIAKETLKPKISTLIILALDTFLSQNK